MSSTNRAAFSVVATWLLLALLIHGSLSPVVESFVLRHHKKVPSFATTQPQRNAIHDNNGDDHVAYFEALAHNKARTDVRNFLTQRSIQSFIFLLISCRDDPTIKWLESQYEFKNLDNYHGTGALDLKLWSTWDSILIDLLDKPKDIVVVTARRRGRGKGGWSENNPHTEVSYVEYEIDIDFCTSYRG